MAFVPDGVSTGYVLVKQGNRVVAQGFTAAELETMYRKAMARNATETALRMPTLYWNQALAEQMIAFGEQPG